MNEAGRFLRYITPGVVFGVESVALLAILRPDLVSQWAAALTSEHVVGTAIGGLLISGGLGYIFSALHHTAHWHPRLKDRSVIDHTPFVGAMVRDGVISLRNSTTGAEVHPCEVTREGAWVLLSGLWHERTQSSDYIAGASPRMWSLADLVHSNGATRIAAIAAAVAAFLTAMLTSQLSLDLTSVTRFAGAFAVAVGLVWLHQHGYLRVGRFFQSYIEQVLATTLVAERDALQAPITIQVSDTLLASESRAGPDIIPTTGKLTESLKLTSSPDSVK